MTLYLAGTFVDKGAAVQAIQQLKASGYGSDDLAVFSDGPVEFPRGVIDQPSRMSLAAVSGAIASFLLTVAFVYFTQYDYRLVTGGMPIFSFWPTGVIFFEMTMLGAVLTTTAWFIWESGLLRRDKAIPVPVIEPEVVCLRVRCTAEKFATTAALLEQAGAHNVAKLEKAA